MITIMNQKGITSEQYHAQVKQFTRMNLVTLKK